MKKYKILTKSICILLFFGVLVSCTKSDVTSYVNKTYESEPKSTIKQTAFKTPTDIKNETLSVFLNLGNVDYKTLKKANCKQLIVVESDNSDAHVHYFYLSKSWKQIKNLTCNGFVGIEGVTENFSENSKGSPKGFFPIGEAFYINNTPETKLDKFQITKDTYWIDDPDSIYYNQRVDGTKLKDWNSAEHMISYATEYEYGFVIKYNMPPVYNKGSAIFFHIGNSPTLGCVAVDKKDILKYLKILDKNLNPYILII